MHIVSWASRERTISADSSSEFFDSPLEQPTLFHFTTSRLRMDPHGGAFSLKIVFDGVENYHFGRRRQRLHPGQLLFVAAGRHYASEIASRTESLSLFVPDVAAADLWRASQGSHEQLIDAAPAESAPCPPAVAWRSGDRPAHATADLRRALRSGSNDEIRDAANTLLLDAARSWRCSAPVNELAGPRRVATREELVARVMRARDMILDLGGVGCSLDRLALEACLSRFHLLRVFREALGITPGDFARRVRIEQARTALALGCSEHEAARSAGYSRTASLRRAARQERPARLSAAG